MEELPANFPLEYLDRELVVLAISEIRAAERVEHDQLIETADGSVWARPGDFVVSMPNGERYPIEASIFFGTYEVISVVGRWFLGRRLRHPRRAWAVKGPAVELDYGVDRGVASVTRGGWVYQSDDDDFGLINEDAQKTSYELVSGAAELAQRDWHALFRRLTLSVIVLPPLLVGAALLAIKFPVLSDMCLVVEALLLLAGVGVVWRSRQAKWALKAALMAGREMARDYQVAVVALGAKASDRFAMMALWRAAQDDAAGPAQLTPENLRAVKRAIDRSCDQMRREAQAHHRVERVVETVTWCAAFTMLGGALYVMRTHDLGIKLLSIWLPAVVSAAHAWHWHRQVGQRAHAAGELTRMLRFLRIRLAALTPRDELRAVDDAGRRQSEQEVVAALRMLCLCVARHSQRELYLAAAEEVPVPV